MVPAQAGMDAGNLLQGANHIVRCGFVFGKGRGERQANASKIDTTASNSLLSFTLINFP